MSDLSAPPHFNQKWAGLPVDCPDCLKSGVPFFNYVQWRWLMPAHRTTAGAFCTGSYAVVPAQT